MASWPLPGVIDLFNDDITLWKWPRYDLSYLDEQIVYPIYANM